MATHVFKVYSCRNYSYPGGPQDVDVAYMSQAMPGQPYNFVRDAPVANEDMYVWASGQYAGQYLFWTTHYMIHRTYLHFTMPYYLSGSSVVSASLHLKLYHVPVDGDFDLVVQRGIEVDGNNTPIVHHFPHDLADYNRTLVDWNGGSVNTSEGVEGNFIEIPLNATGISWLNLTKDVVSKLCIRSSDDINGIPTAGFDHVCAWNSGNTFTLGDKPYLLIEVTLEDGAVTTDDATNVGLTQARWNGEITDSGYWYDQYGFEYKKGLTGTVYSIRVGWTGSGPKVFYYDKSGLDPATTYYYRAWKLSDVGKIYGEWVSFFTGAEIVNIRATYDSPSARVRLYGEILDLLGLSIVERGFEYKIQDAEPSFEDSGTEVKELNEGGFATGEYYLKNKELYFLQYEEDNIIWWFRAYCKDDGDNKHTALTWMKNMPTVTTQAMNNINYNKADGNGTIVSQGASELTVRGFTVLHEFYGRLPNSWRFEIGGFEGEPEQVVVHDAFGVTVIDIHWEGDLIKTVSQWYALEIGAFSITIGKMLFGWPIMQDCLVEGKDYKCKAFAENEFGRAYGEEVDFSTWARTYFSEDPPTVGEISIVKNEIIENLPVGVTASRRGFRYGTTEAADEFDVHENGSFTNGPYSMMLVDLLPDTTYYVYAYIVVEGIIYEGNMETITTDPEGMEDEDEYPTPHFSPHGQDYREMETKVFAEVLASQGIIDFSGGKKTLSLVNHLIQANPNAKIIADNYLDRFKLAKTRMTVTFPTPLPFEREDTVDFSYGALLFKDDDEGIAHFKEDGEGTSVLMDQISMIIKKINSVGLTKTPESIEYVAVLDLEHE